MDILHRSMMEQLSALPMTLLLDLLERKLKEHDVTLTQRQRTALRRALESQDWSDLVLPVGKQHKDKKVTINISADDIGGIESQVHAVLDRLPEMIHTWSEDMAAKLRLDYDKGWPAEDKRRRRYHLGFERRLGERWKKPMSGLRQLIVMASELGESVNNRLRKEQLRERPYTIEVQTRLHALRPRGDMRDRS